MKLLLITHAVFALALVAGTVPALAVCQVAPFMTADNQTVPGSMTTTSNSWCSVSMGIGIAGIADAAILKNPRNGEIVLKGFRVFYRSKKGFTGTDTFTYTRTQNDRWGNMAKRTVDMTVTAIP